MNDFVLNQIKSTVDINDPSTHTSAYKFETYEFYINLETYWLRDEATMEIYGYPSGNNQSDILYNARRKVPASKTLSKTFDLYRKGAQFDLVDYPSAKRISDILYDYTEDIIRAADHIPDIRLIDFVLLDDLDNFIRGIREFMVANYPVEVERDLPIRQKDAGRYKRLGTLQMMNGLGDDRPDSTMNLLINFKSSPKISNRVKVALRRRGLIR